MTARREEVAEELRGQHARINSMGHLTRESAEFLADALLPLVERLCAEAAAEALTETATKWQYGAWLDVTESLQLGVTGRLATANRVTTWLRARAAALRSNA